MQFPQKAVILAGGKGTRLRPLTNTIPKALLPVHGKTLTEHLFDLFLKYDITEIVLSVGHLKEKIMDYFGDGKRFGVHITYIEEKEPLGTAGPLLLAKEYLRETFIACNGDELKEIDIAEMAKVHNNHKALATLALTSVQDPQHYGVAKLHGNRILMFVEKPAPGTEPSKLINSGFYIMEPEVLNYIPEGFAMLETNVFPQLANDGKLFGYPFHGQWFDTGTMERYERAKQHWRGIRK